LAPLLVVVFLLSAWRSQRTQPDASSQERFADDVIVFEAPALEDNARFVQVAEEFTVKAFIAKLIVKARSPKRSRG
jgi:hypothetical protein